MKKFLLHVLVALMGLMLVSCADKSSLDVKPFLDVKQTNLSVDANGDSYTLSFSANDAWIAFADKSWCNVSPARGDASAVNEASFTITCDPNPIPLDRSCTVTISCAGISRSIQISQGFNHNLFVSQSSYDLTNDAQTISIEIITDVDFTYTIDSVCADWVKAASTKSLSSNIVLFDISKNNGDTREGRITFSQNNGPISRTILIKQGRQDGAFGSMIGPHFNKGVELMWLIWKLAEVPYYDFDRYCIREVSESADSYFAEVKDHEAVSMAAAGFYDVAYDAIAAYGMHLAFSNEGTISFNPEYVKGSDDSFDRWSEPDKQRMLAAVNDFYRQSNFNEWYSSLEPLRQQAIAEFNNKICDIDYEWFPRFYGTSAENLSAQIVLSFLTAGNNFGLSARLANGKDLLSQVICASPDASSSRTAFFLSPSLSEYLYIIIHELSHPFCNPLIDQYWGAIKAKANSIYSQVAQMMEFQGYSSPRVMMYETLVRACSIRYLITHPIPENEAEYVEYIETFMNIDQYGRFILVPTLVDVLEKREQQQDQYATLDDFMPEIIKAINDYQL